jgi:hypothetical protein
MTGDGLTVNLNATVDGAASCQWVCTGYDEGSYTVTDADKVAANVSSAIGAASATGNNTNVTLKKAGTYTFVLKATNSAGTTESSPVVVSVTPWNATKDVGVSFLAFGTNPTVINLNPIYTPNGGWGIFDANEIAYTIKDDKGNDFTVLGNLNFTRDSSKYSYGMWPWPPPLFTQTFYDSDDNKLGEYSFYAGDFGGEECFNQILDDAYQAISSLPPTPLTLQLAKTIAEVE